MEGGSRADMTNRAAQGATSRNSGNTGPVTKGW